MAGSVGGRSIAVPAKGTRPTSERTREAIFSRLVHYDVLDGARVLDLYAGSGALGLEAASRGAVGVTLVDSARGAVEVAKRNVATLGLGGTVRVVGDDAGRFAAGLATAPGEPLDLVFLDPPYDLSEAALGGVLASLCAPGVLAPDAVVVVERSTRSPEPAWPDGLEPLARKDYGETAVYYAEPS
ncbi:methyltransferase [Xylanimonas cellulosilytica DSM 15894]|uniref:Methyltransferase n=1 Tax=Xylanimonas cellulosilytica (strain DSM 15894 / JCM 12276 / CECT 5975 / KCTC 9989 / LMG 20990 / NBRC 107835 / XIL07) TaxID=446471 RepID=D1BV57_XYLCX|nr:methyltransferase [Xylanimonas cellulosilytica DSM 15894]